MSNKVVVKILVSVGSVLVGLTHILFPKLSIDAITITLIAIAIVPWLETLFKSIELPGGVKMEFQDLEKATDKAIKAGLIIEDEIEQPNLEALTKAYSFIDLAIDNPALALTGLRIEIEKRLRRLAEKFGLEIKGYSISSLMQNLSVNGIINAEEDSALRDMVGALNQAAHGIEFDIRNVDWIIKTGPAILESLDNKLEDRGGRFSVGKSDERQHWIDISYANRGGSTTKEMIGNINEHTALWEIELANIYLALLKKLKSPHLEKLIESQEHWTEQLRLEREFIQSFDDLRMKVGTGGLLAIASSFMGKVRERTLELDEILSLFAS
ncbi:lysozyme inhibitor LprI family protein [Pedobacter ginsengisoli]|uniref:lysozyme inhibitor LprI family protein n=1 Tax=Pedobacter ginsengisoli TaxID=363852 RepID=UPI00254E42E0|nr:lysozyme inhibitor LprI family protein [Pedobacter ginsengisoli]